MKKGRVVFRGSSNGGEARFEAGSSWIETGKPTVDENFRASRLRRENRASLRASSTMRSSSRTLRDAHSYEQTIEVIARF